MSEKEQLAKQLAETSSKWEQEREVLMVESKSEVIQLREELKVSAAQFTVSHRVCGDVHCPTRATDTDDAHKGSVEWELTNTPK